MPSVKEFVLYSYKEDRLVSGFILFAKLIKFKNAFKLFHYLIHKG